MHPTSRYLSATLLLVAGAVRAQAPSVFDQVGFEQRLGAEVPGSLTFRDHTGRDVRFDEYFGNKPVLLSLVYFECPMLCSLELNGLVRSLRTLPLVAGKDFTVLTVSFDPGETPELAASKRRHYLQRYDRPEARGGWTFLTGDEANIRRLCEAVGFRYVYDADRDEFAHASGVVVLTPEGIVARYFYGIDFSAKDLRLGLVEASAARIGSPTDQLLLLCYGYDPATGKYGFLVMRAIRWAGLVTVVALGGLVGGMLYQERRSRTRRSTTSVESTRGNAGKPAACRHPGP